MKINKKYGKIVFAFFMSLSMSVAISFTITLLKIGFSKVFLKTFFNGSLVGFAVSFPLALVIFPAISKLVTYIVDE